MGYKLDQRTAIEKYNDPNTQFLTLNETAILFNVAYSTVREAAIKSGQITNGVPVIRIGRLLKVRAIDMRKLLGKI